MSAENCRSLRCDEADHAAHFAVLQEAGLIDAEKSGRTIIYRLVMSVLEEALLGFAQTFGWGLNRSGRLASLTTSWRSGPPKEKSDMAPNWTSSRIVSVLPLMAIGLALANWSAKPAAAWAWVAVIVISVVMVVVQRLSQLAWSRASGDAASVRSVDSVAGAVVFGALMMIIPLALTLARAYGVVDDPDSGMRRQDHNHDRGVLGHDPATPCPGCSRRLRQCRAAAPDYRRFSGLLVGRGRSAVFDSRSRGWRCQSTRRRPYRWHSWLPP